MGSADAFRLDSGLIGLINDDPGQGAARYYESSDRIGMMHTNRSDYLRIRRVQAAVNDSNSLDF